MSGPKPRRLVAQLPYYVGGESEAPGAARTIKLSSNESALGAGESAIEACRRAAACMSRYPDPACTALRAAIAAQENLNADQIVCGAGSEDLLMTIAHGWLEPGDEVVYSQFAFPLYRIAAIATGATPVTAPEQDYRAGVEALLAAVTPRTRILFLANPNNPTGTLLPFAEIRRLHHGLRPDVLLVLDAAYAEYAAGPDYDSGLRLVREGAENVLVTRTFSKIHGLAALRVGWAYGPAPVIEALNRVRRYFNVNGAAQAAARAALQDAAHTARARAHNDRWLPWLENEIRALGFATTQSAANFVLMLLNGGDASACFQFLKQRGIITRPGGPYGIGNGLRITVGTGEENELLVAALREWAAAR